MSWSFFSNGIEFQIIPNSRKVKFQKSYWLLFSTLYNNKTTFNSDISNWDVSNVTNMFKMFSNAGSFNQDLSDWDLSSVTNMNHVFFCYNCDTIYVLNERFGHQDFGVYCSVRTPGTVGINSVLSLF